MILTHDADVFADEASAIRRSGTPATTAELVDLLHRTGFS